MVIWNVASSVSALKAICSDAVIAASSFAESSAEL